MSGLIFCSFKQAAKPYYLESAKQNIYSIEELCYFLQDNIYLLDENIMTTEFCDWLEMEVEAVNLAQKLRRILEGGKRWITRRIMKTARSRQTSLWRKKSIWLPSKNTAACC